MENKLPILLPVFGFLFAMLAIAFALQRKAQKDFIKEYFIGGRRLGGFVLAMTLVATYSSVSSFVGGPGLAWQHGFGWVYYAAIQIVSAFLVLGVVGKKIAVVGRKIDAVTIVDVIRSRYGSDALANLSALVVVAFFAATIVAQFVGGANLFSAVAGVNYRAGLFIFALVVVVYTSVGGFRGVAVTDAICALAMLLGIGVTAYAIVKTGGGIQAVMAKVAENPARLQPTAGGALSIRFLISQWLLCGFCTIGLPQSLVRNLSYRDSRALHRAMLTATIVIGAMMIGMHLLGVLSRAVVAAVPDGKTTDAIIPTLIVGALPPLLAGVAIIGPLAATMSTVSSLLIASSSAIIKDVYQHYKGKKEGEIPPRQKIRLHSMLTTLVIGVICVLVSLKPPSVIVWINLFAFGGLQTAFFWTIILGLFWKRANAAGALFAMIGSVAAYCLTMALKIPLGGFHPIVVGIGVSLVLFIAGSLFGPPPKAEVTKTFFP
jgi:sodium/pantothenate symporter